MHLLGNPYDGKASDMWAMGVLLYTMLYGQFPFYDEHQQELFKKIKAADFSIPRYVIPLGIEVHQDYNPLQIQHRGHEDAGDFLTNTTTYRKESKEEINCCSSSSLGSWPLITPVSTCLVDFYHPCQYLLSAVTPLVHLKINFIQCLVEFE
jgi:serine/threonine protein kinase